MASRNNETEIHVSFDLTGYLSLLELKCVVLVLYNCNYYIIVYYFLLFKCKVDHPNKPTEFWSKHNYLVLLLVRKTN